jgi:hypothetical protein
MNAELQEYLNTVCQVGAGAEGEPLTVIQTVQSVPPAIGNTTNLNSVFEATDGYVYIIDSNGNAIKLDTPQFKNLNEFHVDKNGSDTMGDGSQENPFLTISKAIDIAVAGDQVIVHAGSYTEDLTINSPNIALVGAQSEYGSLTQINGTVTVTAVGTSVKISDLGITSVVHSGSAPLYLENTTVYTTLDSSSVGYLEIKNSSIQDGAISKSAGILLIEQSKIDNVSITEANTVGSIRNSYQDIGSTITYGAGTVYNIQNVQGGDVVINASAIPLETAVLAQGGTAEIAKEAETSDFMKLGMIRPDFEASPTKYVTWDEVTGRLEVSNAPDVPVVGQNVYIDATNPSSATIFDTANPPVTNDNALKNDSANTYYGTDGSVWTWNGTAYITKTYSYPTHKTTTTLATAGQVSHTLPQTPIGAVIVTRNGIDISNSWTWVGAVGTYNPANNYNAIMDANDKLIFHYESL